MKTVILTGATSFLGRNLLKGLLVKEYKVYAFVRQSSSNANKLPPQNRNLEIIYGSLDHLEVIEKNVEKADYFIHFGWDGSGNAGRANAEIQGKNVEYSMNALKAAHRLGCQAFIFPGSQAEYGLKQGRIYETEECSPVSEYGKAKLEFSEKAEVFCKELDMKFIHLRIFSVYGPGDRKNTLVDACIRKFNSGEVMSLGPCTQRWNYLYIDDFVKIVLRMMKSECEAGIYNIASLDTRILREFVGEIYELSNKTGKFDFEDTAQNPEGSPELIPDVGKMLSATGSMEMTPFRSGILKTMNSIFGQEAVL